MTAEQGTGAGCATLHKMLLTKSKKHTGRGVSLLAKQSMHYSPKDGQEEHDGGDDGEDACQPQQSFNLVRHEVALKAPSLHPFKKW